MDYLYLVKSRGTTSATFFNFTVYGLRYACKLRGLAYESFGLPSIDHDDKLPVVLNQEEVRLLLKNCGLLKHRLLIGLLYGCGLRCSEFAASPLPMPIWCGGCCMCARAKAAKTATCLGPLLTRGIATYIDAVRPQHWIFEGNVQGQELSQRGTQWVVSMVVKKAGITKAVSTHTLRHSYAAHLLEQGVNILSIKELLGHESIDTTMVYLHCMVCCSRHTEQYEQGAEQHGYQSATLPVIPPATATRCCTGTLQPVAMSLLQKRHDGYHHGIQPAGSAARLAPNGAGSFSMHTIKSDYPKMAWHCHAHTTTKRRQNWL